MANWFQRLFGLGKPAAKLAPTAGQPPQPTPGVGGFTQPANPAFPSPASANPFAAQQIPVAAGGAMGQFREIGVSGLRIFTGYLDEEFISALKGSRGRRTYRQMAENDPTIAAILHALTLLLRAVKWTAKPAGDPNDPDVSAQAQAEADFAQSLFVDMSHTWEDFIAEVVQMLVFGWAYFEIVMKRRLGQEQLDPTMKSQFDDGRIGIRKLGPRAQETLLRWETDPDLGLRGMWQIPPQGGGTVLIPIERALLFRTTSRKDSPEGVSVLRGAYRPWLFLTRIQEYEAIGIERELAGLPVVKIPSRYFTSTDPKDKEFLDNATKIARDLKMNSQGAIVVASDVYMTADGNPSSVAQVQIDLMKGAGSRTIETPPVKLGYQTDIARSVLAQFIMLGGSSKGAYNLAESQMDMFYKAGEAFLNQIAAVLNRYLIPRIFDANAIDPELRPTMEPGRLMPMDTAGIGTLISQLAQAGAPIFPNTDLLNFIFDEASLPEVSDEALAEQETAQQQALEQKQQQQQQLMDAGGGGGGPSGKMGKFDEAEHPRGRGGKFTVAGELVSALEHGELPAHIQALKIPPAWTDVRFNPDPQGDLLAIGKDSKGRSQRVYSAKFQGDQAAQKFNRIAELESNAKGIAAKNDENRASSDPKIAEHADALHLVMNTGVRPGSEDDTGAEQKAYGATTLEGRHVTRSGASTALQFVGKKGVSLNLPIANASVASMLASRAAAAGPGGQLFPNVSDASLRNYVHGLAGDAVKVKDFRTLVGTSTARAEVAKMPTPKTPAEKKRAIASVAKAVSSRLGNTPAIALTSYIHPAVFGGWAHV